MDLPKTIKIAAHDIKIVPWDAHYAHDRRKFGEWSSQNLEIRLDVSTSPVNLVDSLIHELNHAIYWIYCIEDEDKEERTVSVLTTAWVQVFRDNPGLMMFIHHNLHARKSFNIDIEKGIPSGSAVYGLRVNTLEIQPKEQ